MKSFRLKKCRLIARNVHQMQIVQTEMKYLSIKDTGEKQLTQQSFTNAQSLLLVKEDITQNLKKIQLSAKLVIHHIYVQLVFRKEMPSMLEMGLLDVASVLEKLETSLK